MLARLTALPVDERPDDTRPAMLHARVRLAEQLAQLQLYAVLSPLEKLFARKEEPVKVAVLQSLQTLFFKRSFVTVRAALRDPDGLVVDQACKAVEALYFQHAVDPLSRILRESLEPAPRASALRALAKIDTLEAAEILLGALEHGAPPDRLAALAALKAERGSKFAELAKGCLPSAKDPLRGSLQEILAARGLAA
jgi:HEAT repeat protein